MHASEHGLLVTVTLDAKHILLSTTKTKSCPLTLHGEPQTLSSQLHQILTEIIKQSVLDHIRQRYTLLLPLLAPHLQLVVRSKDIILLDSENLSRYIFIF